MHWNMTFGTLITYTNTHFRFVVRRMPFRSNPNSFRHACSVIVATLRWTESHSLLFFVLFKLHQSGNRVKGYNWENTCSLSNQLGESLCLWMGLVTNLSRNICMWRKSVAQHSSYCLWDRRLLLFPPLFLPSVRKWEHLVRHTHGLSRERTHRPWVPVNLCDSRSRCNNDCFLQWKKEQTEKLDHPTSLVVEEVGTDLHTSSFRQSIWLQGRDGVWHSSRRRSNQQDKQPDDQEAWSRRSVE